MRAILQGFFIVCCLASVATAQWSGKASPHDGQHLVVIRPTEWQSTADRKAVATPVPACAFGAEAAIRQSIEAPFTVRHAGEYVAWIGAIRGRMRGPLEALFCEWAKSKAGQLATLLDHHIVDHES